MVAGVSGARTQMLEEIRPVEAASNRDRRSFLRKVGLASLGAAAAAPLIGGDKARAASNPAYTDAANTFTQPQTMVNGGGTPPLTVKGDSPGYPFHVRDRASNELIARIGSSAVPGEIASVLVLHGTNGLGTYGAAWQIGVDVAVPPRNRDFFIAKVEADDSVRDVLYVWNNGAGSDPAVDIFPAGPSYPVNASMAINGRQNSQSDPPMLMLRPNAGLDGHAMVIKVITEAQPRWGISKDGVQSWGPGGTTPPGGKSGATGVSLERLPGSGIRISQGGDAPGVSRTLVLNNTRPRTGGDGTGIAFAADGFNYARIDSTFGNPGGKLSFQVQTSGTTFTERMAMDINGIGFNGARPIVPPTWGWATASNKYGAQEQQMLNRLYSLCKALGFFN
jgi:hypothetical protein